MATPRWATNAAPDGAPEDADRGKERRPPPTLKSRALALLARREYSRAELVRKLSPSAENAEQLDRVLDELAARGLLNDARVLEVVIASRAPRHGLGWLRQDLQRKGIGSDLSAPALNALRDSEVDRAWALWQQRFGRRRAPSGGSPTGSKDVSTVPDRLPKPDSRRRTVDPDQRERARQQRFLLSRGFSPSVVAAVLRRATDQHLSPDDDAPGDPP